MAKTKQQDSFLYEDKTSAKNSMNKAIAVQPTMLPPLFREKSRLLQKIYLFLIVIAIAVATGITSFVMLDDFSNKYGITSGSQVAYLVIVLVMWFLLIATSSLYVWWSRTRAHLFTVTSVIGILVSPIALSASLLYLDFQHVDSVNPDTAKNLFFILGMTACASGGVVGLLILIRNFLSTKVYRDAKFRSMYTILGLLVVSAAPIVLWMTAKNMNFGSFEISQFIYSIATIFGGAILMTFGVMLSMKYKFSEVKSTTTAIKLSGSLPTIIIFTSLLTIALKFMNIFSVEFPLLIVIAADLVLLLMFGIFLFFKARIKNIGHTNPLFNEFVMKGFILVASIIGMIIVSILPELIVAKSYAPLSFTILASTAATVIIIVLLGHFTNLIVFEKFVKSAVASATITVLLILVIVFVIGTLSRADVIMQIISRSIVMFFMIVAIVGEVIMLGMDIIMINKDVIFTARFVKKKHKSKKDEDKKEKVNVEEMA